MPPLYDAHLHFQFDALVPHHATVVADLIRTGVRAVVVNATNEDEFPLVASLCAQFSAPIIPGSPLSALNHPLSISGRDLRIAPDTGHFEPVSGQTQFGRERNDAGDWFGSNNSRPIWHYALDDRYLRRNPHLAVRDTKFEIAAVPGAAPVFPMSQTLARFNDFDRSNRFTSACSTTIYRDRVLGDAFNGNAFVCEPVHNLVSRLVLTPDGATFKARRADDEQDSEFLASSDNWFRPVMVRTGPDGALWIADMYRAVIEHPRWIPPEWQRKLALTPATSS